MLLSHMKTRVCLKYFVNYCSFGVGLFQYIVYHTIKAFYNQFHNILRLADVLPNFPFTISETIHDYYL